MGVSGLIIFAPLIQRAQPASGQPQQQAAPNVLEELTPEEEKQVAELKKTDTEVRQHEQAHKTVGGAYAGAISYQTTTGPDGRQYAVAGEVQIDTSPVPNNPEATIRKADVIERAALAPPAPSPQDIAVARAAQQLRLEAQRELLALQEAEQEETQEKQPTEIERLLAEERESEATDSPENAESRRAAENLTRAADLAESGPQERFFATA